MRLEPALRDRWVPMVGASYVRPWYVAGAYIPGRVGALPTIKFIRAPLEGRQMSGQPSVGGRQWELSPRLELSNDGLAKVQVIYSPVPEGRLNLLDFSLGR
jgi:hypothetical protein